MNLIALPAFTDNIIWRIDDGTGAIAVDPGEPESVAQASAAGRTDLAAILVTADREERHSAQALDVNIDLLAGTTHTAGHTPYVDSDGAGEPVVLRGDNLLPAGSGTLVQRTAEQMDCTFR